MTQTQSKDKKTKQAATRKMMVMNARAKENPRKLVNLTLTAGEATDGTRIVFNNAQSRAYESECDAAKFETQGVIQLFTIGDQQERYAINERPADNGIVMLGFTAPSAGEFSISASRMDTPVYLKDRETGSVYDLRQGAYQFSAGAFHLTDKQGDAIGFDTLAAGEDDPEYHEGDLAKLLGARSAFLGCGTSSDPTGLPLTGSASLATAQTWVALKSRFFATLVMPPVAAPCTYGVSRDPAAKTLQITGVNAAFTYPAMQLTGGVSSGVVTRLYVGPKLLSNLKAFGNNADEVMDFGMFSWFCALLLPILNFFYNLIPNYGVAIVLLTLLVRVVFWPLTHKSTVSMRKMSVVQPQIKALQAQFKDNPQKLQQETLKLYREHKVNPFSSCLPMLVQIPIFIALFTVLRSAVELRFADFLWIADLSQPENLFAGILPMPLNILPILTAVTMGLQTHLSPASGDPAQKKMMTWMMPIMLLFMFYSMPSALCLYWTISQVLSIAQMWYIHKTTATTPTNA
jgi:YidC/Oxa1 family membrane protein insertase